MKPISMWPARLHGSSPSQSFEPELQRCGKRPRSLSILHLEDNPADRELTQRALRAAGFSCLMTYAVSREDFEQYVQNQQFDLIISDYTLPGYSGGAALKFAHEKVPDCPFVFLSGTIGEERAVESLRLGAADFVLKDRMNRLVPTLQRVIDDSDRRAQCAAAEHKLRVSEERFRRMADTIPDVFWIADPARERLEYVSPAFERIFGLPTDRLHSDPSIWAEVILPEDRVRFFEPWKPLPSGAERTMSYRIQRPDGKVRWMEERRFTSPSEDAHSDRIIGITSDVTERKQLEADLSQAQKLEAIGQMAGKTAHDFNNFIVVICGHAQLLLSRKDLPTGVRSSILEIQSAGERSAKLTKQLLLFGRKQLPRLSQLPIEEVVDGAMNLLRDLASAKCEVERLGGCPGVTVFVDRAMMEQVLMNLVVNARDAMPNGGKIVIAMDTVSRELDSGAKRFVRTSVRDSGEGIPPEVLPRIFEPFYTTKESNKGTGLGLATVFGIVKQHHGWIEVESVPGEGSTFHVYLPAHEKSPKS